MFVESILSGLHGEEMWGKGKKGGRRGKQMGGE